MKIIICGAGRVGMSISEHLSNENNDITVIDSKSEALKKITDLYDVQGVLGLASHPSVLKDAGIEDSEMLIAVTESDEINIMACHLSSLIYNTPTKIARIKSRDYLNEEFLDLFQEGKIPIDHIISPEEEVASAIVKQWRTPGAFDVAEFCNSQVTMLGILCNSNCPILDTPLRELVDLFPGLNATIMAIIRGNDLIIPRSGDDVLNLNDRIYLSCQSDQIDRTLAAFGHSEITSHNVTISGAGNLGIMIGNMINKISPDTNLTYIEVDKDIARNAAEQLEFASIISGDTLDPEIIKEARVTNESSFIAATNHDEVNILSSLLTKRSGTRHNIVLLNQPAFLPLVNTLDLEAVISPPLITVSSVLKYIRKGQIEAVHSIIEEFGEVISVEALETSSIIGIPLKETRLPKNVSIGSIVKKNNEILPARGNSVINPGDKLVMFVPVKSIKKVQELLSVRLDYF
ncbi:MAG: Trk system potassium transporter TrkA [SAR116 cluster bacterium]|nr:Trk system potassium transporter TrkA [SAR116 cluster bacterium]RPH11555.1 MAG: Trk system potassium transporter TrkA [Alphaproteobacteria bacterium TMED54]